MSPAHPPLTIHASPQFDIPPYDTAAKRWVKHASPHNLSLFRSRLFGDANPVKVLTHLMSLPPSIAHNILTLDYVSSAGASASLGCLLLVAWRVQLSSLPVFVRQWRDHGLLSPLYCTLIWSVPLFPQPCIDIADRLHSHLQTYSLKVFVRQWRDHGLLSPLYCTLIWSVPLYYSHSRLYT
jgi:hypothetical protein